MYYIVHFHTYNYFKVILIIVNFLLCFRVIFFNVVFVYIISESQHSLQLKLLKIGKTIL